MPTVGKPKNIDKFVNGQLMDVPLHMKYQVTEDNFFMDFHAHEGYEIYFFWEGEGCFLIEDQIFPLHGNDLILIGSQESHRCSPELGTSSTRTVIHFLPELLDPVARQWLLEIFHTGASRRHIRLWDEAIRRLKEPVERIYEEYASRPNNYLYGIRVYLNQLLFELQRIVMDESEVKREPSAVKNINPKIELAVKYIGNHFHEDLSLASISSELYINPYYLSHLFKSTVGITIGEFLLQMRIHHAKRLLLYTDHSISEISVQVGFNNSSYFGQAFKSKTGIPPREYRKSHKRFDWDARAT